MNEWKCLVKTPSNFLQTVRVEAYTHSDAVAFAESMTGGKCITASLDNSFDSDDNDDDNSSSSGIGQMDGAGVLFLLAVIFIIAAWKYILIIGAISLVVWFIIKMARDS